MEIGWNQENNLFSPRQHGQVNFMKQFILQLGKQNKVCSDIEEAKEFISRFGHLTSAGEKRLEALFDDVLTINRDFAWMMHKHIP